MHLHTDSYPVSLLGAEMRCYSSFSSPWRWTVHGWADTADAALHWWAIQGERVCRRSLCQQFLQKWMPDCGGKQTATGHLFASVKTRHAHDSEPSRPTCLWLRRAWGFLLPPKTVNTCRRCPSGACCQTPDRKNSSPAHQNHSSASIQIRQRNNMKDCVGSPVCVFSGCMSTRGSNLCGRVCEYTRTGPVQGTGLRATLQCSTFTREHPPTSLNCCTKIPGHTCRHCFLPTENASFKNLSLHKISIWNTVCVCPCMCPLMETRGPGNQN